MLRAPEGICSLRLEEVAAHAEGMILIVLPPETIETDFAAPLRTVAAWPVPVYIAAGHRYRRCDRHPERHCRDHSGPGWRVPLALKANRPATFTDVEAFFTDPPPGALDTCETIDGDHGRIETRRHAVCHEVAWLSGACPRAGEVGPGGPALPRRACLSRPGHDRPSGASWRRLLRSQSLRLLLRLVESETERDGKTARERRYCLSSARLDAGTFARAVRGHWGVENGRVPGRGVGAAA